MSRNTGVWIDHRKAQIVCLTPQGDSSVTILSNTEKHPERGGDSPMQGPYEAQQVPADDRRQRALTADFNRYYDAVIEALGRYDRLLIIGPGEAKGELRARLLSAKSGDLAPAMETAERMTDRQLAAKMNTYFGNADPPVAWPPHDAGTQMQ